MSVSDAALFGLTRAQRMREDDENAARMYGVEPPLGVYRVVPPLPSTVAAWGATWEGCSFFIWLSMERNRRLT